MSVIYWAGDSTTEILCQELAAYLKDGYTAISHAANGRSTKSFIDESRLVPIYDKITKGDFLFIEFGHHDEKKEDPSRYTDPFGEYKVNLGKFINVARNKGAIPVLITPLERKCFDGDGYIDFGGHTEYVAAMKQLSESENVALVDLYRMSREKLREVGEEKASQMYEDSTHLTEEGAKIMTSGIVDMLKELGGIYKEMLA